MANATYEICIDWNLDGVFTGTYDNITADVKSLRFSRGKDDERGEAQVGNLTLTVNNSTGKYSPEKVGGVLYGNLLPKRPIRVRATYATVTYNLFYGYIEEIIPHPLLTEQDCVITAMDGLDFLARADLDTILIKDQLTGYIAKAILNNAGWPNGGIVTDGLILNVPFWQYDLTGATFKSTDNYQHTCTPSGTTWTTLGRTFNGTSDYLTIDDAAVLRVGDCTLEIWYQVGTPAGGSGTLRNLSIKADDFSAADFVGLYNFNDEPGSFVFESRVGGGAAKIVEYYPAYPNGTWVHITATRASGAAIIYIYAVNKASGTLDAGATASVEPWYISGTSRTIAGTVGESRIYNRALTPAEVQQNYLATKWFYETGIDAGQDTVPYWYSTGVKARFAQTELDNSELGFSYVNGAGKFIFEDRHHRFTVTHQTSQATFNNTMFNIPYNYNPKRLYNEVAVVVTPWELQAVTELWRLDEIPSIPAGDTKVWWGDAAISAGSVFADAWTTPVSTTDYTANSQADGLGDNETANISITTTKFAKTIKLSITNNASHLVYITLLKARGTYYDNLTSVTRKQIDTTSQSRYQKRTLRVEGKYMTSAARAQDYADFAITRYKDPQAEIGLEIINSDATLLTQILSREISDRITVVNTTLVLNKAFFIDYMEHDISLSGLEHRVTYRLSDATNEDFWCLDYSALGTGTKLGY